MPQQRVGAPGAADRSLPRDLRTRPVDRFRSLKILDPRLARNPVFAERFSREARALARLDHPNIVRVYDVGRTARHLYLAIEPVDGGNLRERKRRAGLSIEDVLSAGRQFCAALEYAHERGFVHRDVKPENVLLTAAGDVKLAATGDSVIRS